MAKRSASLPGVTLDLPVLHASSAAAVLDGSPRAAASAPVKRQRTAAPPLPRTFHAFAHEDHSGNRQAELFYLQKQIQQQTQMIFVMEDGARVQGVIEWYDRHSIKVRGKSRVLVFKSAIKYLYKAGEVGSAPGE